MSKRPIHRPNDRLPGFRRASPSILLIDDDDARRVETLQYLVRCGYAVTASGSVSEAREIMRYVTSSAMAPQIVIMAEQLECEGGALLRRDLDERFAGIRWIHYPRDRDLCWLGEALGSAMEEFATADWRMDSL
jgi:DNA-binding NtrC family response regulator